jgi:NADP-dependent 3-hydroxy acid dehydrogenase YdfG
VSSLSVPFSGRLAIVTGATGAVGAAIAGTLLAEGANVCALGRSLAALEENVSRGNWPRDRVHLYPVDLTSAAAIDQFCPDCIRQQGRVDILVHSAGIATLNPMSVAAMSDFDEQYQVNVRAPYQITQALLPALIANKGEVVFINSSAGHRASSGNGQYAATKHALRAVADGLREEANRHGVRVLSVYLGRTASRMQAAVHQHEGRPYDASKLLQPEDVASIVVHALKLPRTAEVTDVNVRPFAKSY